MTSKSIAFVYRYQRLIQAVFLVGLVLAVALLPHLGPGFVTSLAINILINGLFAMSLDLLAGYTGMISLGHASFLGIGAYALAYGLGHDMDPWQAIAFALGVVAATVLVIGFVVARVKDLTFAMLTLALGQIVWGLAYRWVGVSGGDNGLPIATRPTIGGLDTGTDIAFYYFVLAVFLIGTLCLWLLTRSPFGLSLRGIRDNETRMQTLGYKCVVHKYVAFVIANFIAGIVGILFAFYNLFVNPTIVDFAHNITAIQMVVLGGMGTLWGPLLGAVLITFVQQFISIYVARWQTLLGVAFLLVILLARAGIWGALTDWAARLHGRNSSEPFNSQR